MDKTSIFILVKLILFEDNILVETELSSVLHLLKQIDNYSDLEDQIEWFSNISENNLLNGIKRDYDSFVEVILLEISKFNSNSFLDFFMRFKNINNEIWKESLLLLLKTFKKLRIENQEIAKKIFFAYHNLFLDDLNKDEDKELIKRIIEIFLYLDNERIIDKNYIIDHEETFMKKISEWKGIEGPRIKSNFLNMIFLKDIFSYNNFNSEIKKDFRSIASIRGKLISDYNTFKSNVSKSEYNYSNVEVYALLLKKKENWIVYLIKAEFNIKKQSKWESKLDSFPKDIILYHRNFPISDYWDWMDTIIKFYKIKIENLNLKIFFKDIHFDSKRSINSNNDLYIKPKYASELYSLVLNRNCPYFNGSDLRLRINENPYENIDELIREEFNYNWNSLDSNKGNLIIFLPKYHARIQKITYTLNFWNIYIEQISNQSLSDYKLFYILKDKEGNPIGRGMISGEENKDNIITIPVPLNMWEIWCRLDYQNTTVDWCEKKKDQIEMNLLIEYFKIINDTLSKNERLSISELNDLNKYIEHFTIFSNINKAIEITISPFIPNKVVDRLFCITEIAERFETFLRKLHADSSDSLILSDYNRLRMKTLSGVLRLNNNFFSSEPWFYQYTSSRFLTSAHDASEFSQNWEKIRENSIGVDPKLQYILMATLCRNISAHLDWNSKVWFSYNPFQITIEMIIAAYLITWKYRR